MRKTLFPFTLFITLMIAGCATSSPMTTPAATPTLPAMPDEWTIKMTHSGGIMGLMRSIEVSSDGSYTVMDERNGKTVSGDLSANELAEFTGILNGMDFSAVGAPEGFCADCFIYDIEIQSNEEKFMFRLNDLNLAESGMEDFVSSLRKIMDSALN